MALPIKKISFDNSVLEVLRGLQWSEDGTRAVIIKKLDRNEYVATNKALEALGGKWNTKAKAHLFPVDPRPGVEGLLESGTLEVVKDDFFETPGLVLDEMLGHFITIRPTVDGRYARHLEPSAGLGAIADALVDRGVDKGQITCVEIDPGRCQALIKKGYVHTTCDDFLQFIPV